MLVWLSSAPAKPSVIGLNILFSEEEKNEGMQVTNFLKEKYIRLLKDNKIREKGKDSEFLKAVELITRNMNTDAKLAKAIDNAGNVVLPMYFYLGSPQGENIEPFPEYLVDKALPMQGISIENKELCLH